MEEKNENGRMLAVKYLPKYTYEDYELWEGDWELIDGIPFAMTPAPGFKHQRINTKLAVIFDQALENEGCSRCKPVIPINLKINDHTVVLPDFSVFCGDVQEIFITVTPKLVAEILSPSTSVKDRNLKFQLYEKQKITYYLIIDPDEEAIEIFELKNDNYQLVTIFKSKDDLSKEFQFEMESDCKPTINFSILFSG